MNHDIQSNAGDVALCKICGKSAPVIFSVPITKLTSHPIPETGDDCPYYQCSSCGFVFATATDNDNQTSVYDEDYWNKQDPDWSGRVSQTLRLLLLANQLLQRNTWELDVLDFGCGMGCAVEVLRQNLGISCWGTDMIKPKFGLDYFLPDVGDKKFDVILACEVIEHFTDPKSTIRTISSMLKPGGVFAFQTAIYDELTGRNWWYIGPANGHISLYSPKSFEYLARELKVTKHITWDNYAGVAAWQI